MHKTMKITAVSAILLAVVWVVAATAMRSGFGRPLRALGIESFECNCSQLESADADATLWLFEAEPRVNKVDRGGPAHGRLKPGDTIVAIDGHLITTVEGGRRFSRIAPATPVVLTVRTGKHTRDETIVPRLVSPEAPRILALDDGARARDLRRLGESMERLSRMSAERRDAMDRTRAELDRSMELLSRRRDKLVIPIEELKRLVELDVIDPDRLLVPAIPAIPELDGLLGIGEASPSGSFGFALSFSGSIKTGNGHDPAWQFDELPEIHTVDPESPADEAGLTPGDVLTHIDGVALDTDEGGRRFSAVRPGQRVEWTVRRDGKARTVEVVAEEREARRTVATDLRYSGSLGDTDIKVTGHRRVRVIEDGDVITITTGDATIRLQKSARR
jgi:hypothetical protein